VHTKRKESDRNPPTVEERNTIIMYGGGYNHPPQSGPPTSQGIPANTYRRRRLSNLGENHNSAGFQNRSLGRPTSNADTQSGHQVPVESIFPPNTSLMPPSTEPMPHPSFGERGHYSTSQATPRTSPPAPVAVRDDHAASMQQAGYSMSSSNTVYSTYNQTRNMTVPTNGVLDNLVPTLDQPYYRSYGGMVDSNVEVEPGHSPSRTPSSYSPSVMQSSTLLPPSGPSNNSLGNTRFSNGLVMPTTAGSGPYVQQLQTQYLGQRQLYPSNPNNDNGYLSHTSRGPLTSDR
jgi:hypothetical protein